jgi:hypothetical protein
MTAGLSDDRNAALREIAAAIRELAAALRAVTPFADATSRDVAPTGEEG